MGSLADTLGRLDAQLAEPLVPRAGLARVLEIARQLPARLTNYVYLELWLHDGSSRVDMIVRVDAAGRELLAGAARGALDERLLAQPGWRRAAAFARAWAAPGGPLERHVAGAWLEFDLAADAPGTPVVPRVFVDFVRDSAAGLSVEARVALALRALRPLLGADLDGPTAESLRACVERLPAGASLPYVGTAVSGGAPVVRVCVRGLGPELPGYLRAVGWPGDVDALVERLLEPLARAKGDPDGRVSILHLDLAPQVLPRIGLEHAFERLPQLQGRLAEGAFLGYLVERGWCDAAVRDGLLRWPGQSVAMLPHEIWHSRVVRRLNHVKLTYSTGGEVGVKAYLCAWHELLSGGTIVGTRPRFFGTIPARAARHAEDRAGPPSDGAGARQRPRCDPPLPTDSAPLARFASPALRGMVFALYRRRGGHAMTMTAKEQQVLEAVLQRSVVDYEFRQQLLNDPRRAIQAELGVSVPANFRVKFIEKDKSVDALVVLPNFQSQTGELSDDDLETVAGGGYGRRVDPDWDDVP